MLKSHIETYSFNKKISVNLMTQEKALVLNLRTPGPATRGGSSFGKHGVRTRSPSIHLLVHSVHSPETS